MIRGTCEKGRLLDIVENFTLFSDAGGALVKLIAKNHQFLGVNNALDAVRSIRENQGRLGVFWHTQGSGKSYSMVFFSQKVLRKVPGNWTFVIVTDRQELDDQIYKTFQSAGAVTEHQVQAQSGEHLKQLLQEDHRNIFTLIQKFHTEKGKTYPKLSDRSDIIVITDEAHRTQYDILALNMRNALPKAAFIGFTGTPLMAGEEKTREVFGEYVSVYNFRQSVEDGTTVSLYYENRIPELQLTNANFNEDMERLIEDAELNEAQEKRLEREFAREYHLITRDERLEKIAEDIVAHFVERGQKGKAMVVSIDKATAVRMYDKVQKHWKMYLSQLKEQYSRSDPRSRPGSYAPRGRPGSHYPRGRPASYASRGRSTDDPRGHPALLDKIAYDKIAYMESTDMAVVVSQSQNEVDDFRKKGLDVLPHRKRMVKEDLESKFKDANDPLRIVFVCAMWITGFDVPSLSTLYLDKLLVFTQELNAEEQRTISEQLSEEELAVFDLLTRPNMDLSEKEKDQVKKVARSLLETLKCERLVLDWRKKQQERAKVLTTVKNILDTGLPRIYTKELYERKCDEVYQHIYDSYYGEGRSIYAAAS